MVLEAKSEKYEKLVKKWRHHFSTREILPEDSPTSSQKLTFESNGKTLAPPLVADVTV